MLTKYKRDMNHNYLILEYQGVVGYEMNMVLNNKIKGLLEVKAHTFNGCRQIYYDITSRQPISRVYEKKEMNAEDVRTLMLSIHLLMEEIKKYLLDSNYIIFHPEYCYCDPETRKPMWIFYPKETEEGKMKELAEFLIDRVEHADKKAVDMVYRFYKMVKDDLFSQKELNTILAVCSETDISENIVCQNTDSEDDTLSDWRENDNCCREQQKIENTKKNKGSIWMKVREYWEERVCDMFAHSPKKMKEPLKTVKYADWETYGLEERESYAGETVVMGIRNAAAERRLRSLSKGGNSYINLNKLPCVLGKMPECSDIVLKDPSVSRMHARIFEKEGEVYLQDLNSTNGSYINNLELESNETVQLKVGDEVTFGNVRYIYE